MDRAMLTRQLEQAHLLLAHSGDVVRLQRDLIREAEKKGQDTSERRRDLELYQHLLALHAEQAQRLLLIFDATTVPLRT
jgi:hypothetical protein